MKLNFNWNKRKKREMLSYEDKPIEEYERENQKEKKPLFPNNKVKNVVVILAVLIAIVGIYSVWKFISPSNIQDSISSAQAKGNGYPVEIAGKSVEEGDTAVLSGNFAYVSDTQFQILNNNIMPTNCNAYDYDILSDICDYYIYLCSKYDKECSIYCINSGKSNEIIFCRVL